MTDAGLRIVFMGSAPLACVCLKALLEKRGPDVVGIVCQPDRPKGRNLKLSGCPVKEMSAASGIPILTPEKVNTPESVDAIRALAPDLVVVVAYGQILRSSLLSLPRMGCVNIHASLLPKYRGAAPIQWAVANGEAETGVTSMYMAERMDAGDMILRRPVSILPDETAGELHDRLAMQGAEVLLQTLELLERGQAPRTPQDESQATFAPKLGRRDGKINWTLPAAALYNRIRGFNPWPGSYCERQEADGRVRAVKVLRCRVEALSVGACEPGTVLETGGDGPLIACGEGALRLLEVQPEGGKAMTGSAYLRGHGLCKGMRLADSSEGGV